MSTDAPPRRKHILLKLGYVIVVAAVGLAALEGGARLLGLGDPVLYYNDAWGGMRPLPDQRVTRLDGATVTIDANGYRTPVADQPAAVRILYLGDSVTWGGSTVDDKALYTEVAAELLRKQGRAVYAMNAGVNGTALTNHAEVFQGYDGKLDALVWLFPWGDTTRSYATVGVLWPSRYKPRLALVEVIDVFLFKYWGRVSRDAPPPTEDFTPEGPAGREEFFKELLAKRTERNLSAVRAAIAEAARRGVPVVLGVTPYRKGNELEPLPPEAVSFLKEMADAGATVFDVSAALADAPDDVEKLYLDVAHFSSAGHRAVGEALGAMLKQVIPAGSATAPEAE
jgi:lysophospholipase L1-like esterase